MNLPKILACLERQTVRPDKVIIHYSHDAWHLDDGFTEPPAVATSLDLEFVAVPNTGSNRKYLHVCRRYADTDTAILLLDDDLVWNRTLVEVLSSRLDRHGAVTTRGWSEYGVETVGERSKFVRGPAVAGWQVEMPTEVLVPSSGWATMFRARDVDPRLFDPKLHQTYQLRYSDEIFLAAMLRTKKFVVPFANRPHLRLDESVAQNKLSETLFAKALQVELLTAA